MLVRNILEMLRNKNKIKYREVNIWIIII
jgi:hypothetical protein